jgi:hypothetical protein
MREDPHAALLGGTATDAMLAGGAVTGEDVSLDLNLAPAHPEATPTPGHQAQPAPSGIFAGAPSTGPPPAIPTAKPDPMLDHAFWFSLINEHEAGEFVGVGVRAMQAWRQRGGGPRFIHISARCIRYRRADLRDWADAKLRANTAEYEAA